MKEKPIYRCACGARLKTGHHRHCAACARKRERDRGRRRRKQALVEASVIRAYGYICSYCLAPLTPKTITFDHVTPSAKGGSNDALNLVPACLSCNSSKCDQELLQWLASKRVAGYSALLASGVSSISSSV